MSIVYQNVATRPVEKSEVGRAPACIIFDEEQFAALQRKYLSLFSFDQNLESVTYKGPFDMVFVEPVRYEEHKYDADYLYWDIDPTNPGTYRQVNDENWKYGNVVFTGVESAYINLYHAETGQQLEFCIY